MERLLTLIGACLLLLALASPAWADGAALYQKNCAQCHGSDGKSDTPVGKAMKAPALAGGESTADAIAAAVRGNPKHKAASKAVSDEELAAIAAYVEGL